MRSVTLKIDVQLHEGVRRNIKDWASIREISRMQNIESVFRRSSIISRGNVRVSTQEEIRIQL